MATLRVTVLLPVPVPGTSPKMYIYSGTSPLGASTGNIGGNIGARVPPSGQHAYDANAIRIPGTISVSSASPAHFMSDDLQGQPSLVGQLSTHIERLLIEVVDDAAPGVPLTRTDLVAFL